MFQQIENKILEQISHSEFTSMNGFLSFTAMNWVNDFSNEWVGLIRALEISVDSFKVEPLLNINLPLALTYSCVLDQDEAFVYIPSLKLNELIARTKLITEDDQGLFVSEVLAEYLVRKLLQSIVSKWRGDLVPDFQFIGLEKSEPTEVTLEKTLGISFVYSGIPIQIFFSIPDSVFDKYCRDFPRSCYLNLRDLNNGSGADHILRLDYCSMGVPTKVLIDVLRKDGILILPETVAFDKVRVSLDEEVVCGGLLKNFSNDLVVQFEESKDLRLPSISPQQTLLTVSLGSMEISPKEIEEMPIVLLLNGLAFSRIELLVGNEVVALGELGHDDSGSLVVRVE